ncbi:hypothetical protein HOH87_02610 [bacterium]|jgi:single-stranded-DNA-specific exonuclease|nr:hypothetical protein [bacterium]
MTSLFSEKPQEVWDFVSINQDEVERVSKKMKMPKLLAKILMFHGIGEGEIKGIQGFLKPDRALIDEYKQISSTEELDKAMKAIAKICEAGEKIVVNGDPDADGITGGAILTAGLRFLGAKTTYDYPVRAKEGHGLQVRIIDEAVEAGAKMIVTTDCGTKDVEAVDYANSKGLDVVVCDHHILGRTLPNALAVINPNLGPEGSPERLLSGAGMSFKLIIAVAQYMKKEFYGELYQFMLACAALGTISDRMSLKEPMNRAIVKHGMHCLNTTSLAGLKALKSISTGHNTALKAHEVSRTITPRLNAPGRIGDPAEGIPDSTMVVDLLLVGLKETQPLIKKGVSEYLKELVGKLEVDHRAPKKEDLNTGHQAEMVEEINEERKKITSKIENEIEWLLDEQVNPEEDRVIVVRGNSWNSGVIGIDTDRLRDRFLRPAIIATEFPGSDYMKGSCRSVPNINMYEIIERVQEDMQADLGRNPFAMKVTTKDGDRLVNAFGGHAQACGFTLHKDDFEEFVKRIRVEMVSVPDEQFEFKYHVIDECNFGDIQDELVTRLDQLSPFGERFNFPIFYMKNCRFGARVRPFGNKYQINRTPHVDFSIVEPKSRRRNSNATRNKTLQAIGFGLWEKYQRIVTNKPDSLYDVIFTIETHHRRYRNSGKNNKGRNNGRKGRPDQPKAQIRLLVQDIRPAGSIEENAN